MQTCNADMLLLQTQSVNAFSNRPSKQPWTPAKLKASGAYWFTASKGVVYDPSLLTVSSWTDQNQNYQLTQAADLNKPLFESAGLNGYTCLRFNAPGTNTSITSPTRNLTVFAGASAFSLFFICQVETFNGALAQRPMFFSDANGSVNKHFPNFATNSFQHAGKRLDAESTGFGSSYSTPGFANGSIILSGAQHNYSTGQGTAYLDGVLRVTSNGQFTTGNSDTAVSTLNVGNSGTNKLLGRIANIVFMPYVPSQSVREQIEGFLAWSVNSPANLPSGHPYKSRRPY